MNLDWEKLQRRLRGLLREPAAHPSRRELLALGGLAAAASACAGPYATPTLGEALLPGGLGDRDAFARDVSAYLPEGLTGRYWFGGGFLGSGDVLPQSTLVELDAAQGTLRRGAWTYAIRRGEPLTDLGGADARDVLGVVRQIGGHVHKVVAVEERDEVYFFPAAGAAGIVQASTLQLKGSIGERVFYADNFCAHPLYARDEGALYYTRMDVVENLDASLQGEPERYLHRLLRRDLATGDEEVVLDGIVGPIVHTVERSLDGRIGVIVFTGDGIRRPFGQRGDADALRRRTQATAQHSRLLLFDWRERRVYADLPTAAVPVHVEFEHPTSPHAGTHVFVQCTNTTFVDTPPTWYGTGAYQRIRVDEGHVGLTAQFGDARYCNVPHSMRLSDDGAVLWSTNADSGCVLGLNPHDLTLHTAIAFEPLSPRHDQHPRGIEQSPDGRYLIVSSNTSIHFYDLRHQRWAGRPIGIVIGERHAHASRA